MAYGHAGTPGESGTTGHAAVMLSTLLAERSALVADLLNDGDRIASPLLMTQPEGARGGHRIVYCNGAFVEMCGYARDDLLGASPQLLQGPETDTAAAHGFAERLRGRGHAGTVLLNYKADGTPYYTEIMAARCAAPAVPELGEGDVFVAFERSLGDLELGEPAEMTRPYRMALLLEDVMRRFLQLSYQSGLHPAQWSALRYFNLAGPDKRSLTDFARHHRTTMGTASTTVSTLVGKGYLIKHGFRGPIELTSEGRALLAGDPLEAVASTFGQLDETGTQWAERILLELGDRLGAEDGPRSGG